MRVARTCRVSDVVNQESKWRNSRYTFAVTALAHPVIEDFQKRFIVPQSPDSSQAMLDNLDIRLGVITAAEPATGLKISAYKIAIDFGPEVGTRKTIAQIRNYLQEVLIGKNVLAVTGCPPKQIGPHRSEVYLLGIPSESGRTVLVVPDLDAPLGAKLF